MARYVVYVSLRSTVVVHANDDEDARQQAYEEISSGNAQLEFDEIEAWRSDNG